jgi:hypothetical protein
MCFFEPCLTTSLPSAACARTHTHRQHTRAITQHVTPPACLGIASRRARPAPTTAPTHSTRQAPITAHHNTHGHTVGSAYVSTASLASPAASHSSAKFDTNDGRTKSACDSNVRKIETRKRHTAHHADSELLERVLVVVARRLVDGALRAMVKQIITVHTRSRGGQGHTLHTTSHRRVDIEHAKPQRRRERLRRRRLCVVWGVHKVITRVYYTRKHAQRHRDYTCLAVACELVRTVRDAVDAIGQLGERHDDMLCVRAVMRHSVHARRCHTQHTRAHVRAPTYRLQSRVAGVCRRQFDAHVGEQLVGERVRHVEL